MSPKKTTILTTHRNSDFDALASLIAATLIYPDGLAVLPTQVNPNVKAFLSIHKDIFTVYGPKEIDLQGIQGLVVVDTASWGRIEKIRGLDRDALVEVHVWDHHQDRGDMATTWDCRDTVGANITLMLRALKKERKLLTPMQATLFLAGLYEDTGNLSFESTTAEDALAAAYLLERKADLGIVNKFLRPAYGAKQKDVLFHMLKAAKRIRINGYKISLSRLEISGHVNNLAIVVRMYQDIVNVDAAFGIFENPDRGRCIVIGRSCVDGLNIGSVMKGLGGGGHPGAGSALLKGVNPEAVEELIRELIEGNQQASVQISDLMSFPVTTLDADAPMDEAARMLREIGCSGFPVTRGDKLVGVISRRDFRKIKQESQLKAPIKAYMSTKVRSVGPGLSPIQAARIMTKYDVGRLPVVVEGKLIGIITRSDTMLYFYDLLPD